MNVKRDELLPYYSQNLNDKYKRLKNVINNIIDYNIEDLKDINKEELEILKFSVINSLKGEIISIEEKTRQNFIEKIFLKYGLDSGYLTYKDVSKIEKCDFIGEVNGYKFGIEVKGGEGNSITLLYRPNNIDIFIVWSHLDVLSNTPYDNMRSVLGRVVKQMINNDDKKQKVDYLVFYDNWYVTKFKKFKFGPNLPDIFVMPEKIPTIKNPHPKLIDYKNEKFYNLIYKIIDEKMKISKNELYKHTWLCDIEIINKDKKWVRILKVNNAYYNEVNFLKSNITKTPVKPILDI